MRKGATTCQHENMQIVALRNEKGSYNDSAWFSYNNGIVALRNEKGSYNTYINSNVFN